MVDPTFKDEYIPVSVITKAYKVKKGKKCEKNSQKYSNTHQ